MRLEAELEVQAVKEGLPEGSRDLFPREKERGEV